MINSKIVLFLQNAWALYDIGEWDRNSWMRALRRCHTGRKLNMVLGTDWSNIHVDNTTRAVGVGSRSKLPPDPEHIKSVLAYHTPDAVVACGKQAEAAIIPLWSGKLLVIPHPASRVLTNALLKHANNLLVELSFNRCAIRQGRGCIITDELS